MSLNTADDISTENSLPTSRRERRQLELRRRILDATAGLVAHEDITAITVEQICNEADVARKTFYNYFSNKQEVIYALCDELLFQHAEQGIDKAIADQNLGTAKFLIAYLSRAAKNLTAYSAVDRRLIAQVMGDALASDRVRQHSAVLHAGFTKLVRRGQNTGELKNELSAEFYAIIILSSINGMIANWTSDNRYPIKEQLDSLGKFLLESICID